MPAGRDFDVKGLRQQLGMTQAELAQAIGVQTATVARWEQGIMKPSPMAVTQLQRMARQARRGKDKAA